MKLEDCPDYDEPYDDRMDRWMAANGITQMGFRYCHDGKMTIVYARADGSEVDPLTSYGYDAALTPYTKTAGAA